MSQSNVERVIGRLVTDEEFRRRFASRPAAVLREWMECGGLELNDCEFRVLSAFDARIAARCARAVDPRIQKADLHGGKP